jgi:predicted DNA-binding transcriptional regulator YafY
VIRIAPGGRWLVERFPVDEVGAPDSDGWSTVRLPVASQQWLVTTMLRLGPDAELVEPAEWRATVAEAATTVLARYQGS